MDSLNVLIYLSIASFIAFLSKRATSKIGMPTVTGYVIAGVILGTSLLGIFHSKTLEHLNIINDFALGIIGFTIGSELHREVFKKLGRPIFIIALFESCMAFIVVTVSIYLIDPSRLYQALILGAVASATAPAATVYVIQQYKTEGPLTSTILAVVGIDDAFALIIYVFASAIAKGVLRAPHFSILHIVAIPAVEIGLSIVLGISAGLIFSRLFRRVRYPDDLLLGIAGFLLLILGVSKQFGLSGILSSMTFGIIISNINSALTHRSSKIIENISPLLFAYFFIFAGSHLNIRLLPIIGITGLVYLLARITGKVGGACLGAVVGKAPVVVKKYIGFSLIPQVGVALALAIMVNKEFGNGAYGATGTNLAILVINILLFTTIITEIVGPLMTKYALTKAGERKE